MEVKEQIRIIGYQPCMCGMGSELGELYRELLKKNSEYGGLSGNNIFFLLDQVYTFGVIQGKRAERARRKK